MFNMFFYLFKKSLFGKKKSGFTFIELIVGLTIISIASVGAWMTMSILTQSTQVSRNRSVARNYLQKSLEEVRRVAQVSFDDLNACAFPTSAGYLDACNFDQTPDQFSGFNRLLEVDDVDGSTEMKSVVVTISWNELGRAAPDILKSTIYFARPPDPLPGNLIGLVTRTDDPSLLVSGARVYMISIIDPGTYSMTTTKNTIGTDGENFDFKNDGRYVLDPGDWQLIAQYTGSYQSYTHPNVIPISSNNESFVAFEMEPLPAPGKIRMQVVDKLTRAPLPSFKAIEDYTYIYLNDNGSRLRYWYNTPVAAYDVTFTDLNPRCFTVSTRQAWRANKTLNDNCNGDPYNIDGYSSARHNDAGGAVSCAISTNGTEAADRICLNSGQDITVDLPVETVPKIQVKGKCLDFEGNPVVGARVRAYYLYDTVIVADTTTSASGEYFMTVPAIASMNFSSYYKRLYVTASAYFPAERCCDVASTRGANASRYYSNLFPSASVIDLGILQFNEVQDYECGDLKGTVKNGKTKGKVSGARTYIRWSTEYTEGNGKYIYECSPDSGYRMYETNSLGNCYVTKDGYYPFRCRYNDNYTLQYEDQDSRIEANTIKEFNVDLWPIGYGTIQGRVTDNGSGAGIGGLTVIFDPYLGSTVTVTTEADGSYTIPNALETWPPPDLPGGKKGAKYNQNSQSHTLTIDGNVVYDGESVTINTLNSGETVIRDFPLNKQGAM